MNSERVIIKSFKHNGSLHRQWLNNWPVPQDELDPAHAAEGMHVYVSDHTPIIEADGKEWVSRVPGVSYFIPGQWYNIVALIESHGIRYYCNIASPPYASGDTITYIDYDLDVIVQPDRTSTVVDQDEYEVHQSLYHYSAEAMEKAESGLKDLLERLDSGRQPFDDAAVYRYYEMWLQRKQRGRSE